MEKILAVLAALILQITSTPIYPTQAWTDQGVFEDMHRRAEAIVSYVWTPEEELETWNATLYQGKPYFQAGAAVQGMPYTLFYQELGVDSLLSLAQFMNKAASNVAATEYCYAVEDLRTGPTYGSCCATFISEVYGGAYMDGFDPIYDSVTGIKGCDAGVTRYDVKAGDIYPGDALSTDTGGHIIWVSTVADEALVIYEQAPPVARRVVVDKTIVDENGYLIYNDNVYNTATRSKALFHEGAHAAVLDEAVEPTCEEVGFTEGSHCGECGLTMLQQRVIPPTGHSNELTEHAAAGETDGWNQYVCTVCGKESRLTIPGEHCAGEQYDDVEFDVWYHEGVDFMTGKGYMQGVSPETFGLEETVTRSQLATILYRASGSPGVKNQSIPFEDVGKNAYYYDAVCWAYGNQVMQGLTETRFAPDAAVTREQLATILYRFGQETPGTGDLSQFPDGDRVSPWAAEAVRWAVEEGLLQGAAVGRQVLLQPHELVTRAQAAVLLMRYFQ